MKLLYLSTLPAPYVNDFYSRHPGLSRESYSTQVAALERDAYAQNGAWAPALSKHGYEFRQIYGNVTSVQQRWARDRGVSVSGYRRLILRQAREFSPEVIFWNDEGNYSSAFIAQLRRACPSVRLIIGHVGTPYYNRDFVGACDLAVTCSQHLVDCLISEGLPARRLKHAFNTAVLDAVQSSSAEQFDICFSGAIWRRPGMHLERERILARLCEDLNVTVFTPSASLRPATDLIQTSARGLAYVAVKSLQRLGMSRQTCRRLGSLGRAADWTNFPMRQIPRIRRARLSHPVYGLQMYRVLDQSHVVWNHTIGPTADNMRLFEATGIGACLLTDQKPNISEHFESDYEIVTYRSPEECVERAKWLLDHPDEGRRIGAAARSRTLRSHTYQHRAVELDQIIQQALVQISRRQYRGRHGE